MLGASELNVLQVGSHGSGVGRDNHIPCPYDDVSFDTVGFLGCKWTQPAHTELFILDLFWRAIPNQLIYTGVIALTSVHVLVLSLVELQEVLICWPLKSICKCFCYETKAKIKTNQIGISSVSVSAKLKTYSFLSINFWKH